MEGWVMNRALVMNKVNNVNNQPISGYVSHVIQVMYFIHPVEHHVERA
jgi:hypothetical protein